MERTARVDGLSSRTVRSGKQVGGALYLHVSALDGASATRKRAVDQAARLAGLANGAFNVVKVQGKPPTRVSLLAYEDFDENPFPALLEGWTVDLKQQRSVRRSYRNSGNPPILHRKELLLAGDDPRRDTFARLTGELERRGLFENPHLIGFRRQWERRLADANIIVRGHFVADESTGPQSRPERKQSVNRHRTAISRNTLSVPMQALARHGFLDGDHSVFDYGCGRGDDLAILIDAGVQAKGWDPHYSVEECLEESDVVNLGYVLNVIDDPDERIKTLQAAFRLTKQVLAIAVLVVGKADTSMLRRYRDGFLTGAGTFQKYFAQEEIRWLIERATQQEPVAVGPGLFFLFRDKIVEQRFLEKRHHRPRDVSNLLRASPLRADLRTSRSEELLEQNREVVEAMWSKALELGRLPHLDELDPSVRRELVERLGSVRKTARLAAMVYDTDALEQQRKSRIEDLAVYFGLNLFSKRRRYSELPLELQRDIKAFFGSYARADEAGQDLLYSLGDPKVIYDAALEASSRGVGFLNGMHSLQLDGRLLDRLSGPLRAFIGCGEQLYGEIKDVDLVKIFIQSSKLTLFRFDHYDAVPMPRLRDGVKIDLREQDVHFFRVDTPRMPKLLYLKSRYMAVDLPGYERQKAFDDQFEALGLFDFDTGGPETDELIAGLRSADVVVRGFNIEQRVKPA